jgi:hypothetical protein
MTTTYTSSTERDRLSQAPARDGRGATRASAVARLRLALPRWEEGLEGDMGEREGQVRDEGCCMGRERRYRRVEINQGLAEYSILP